MVRTIVCEKGGCSGNRFYIESNDEKIELICSQCKSKYNIDVNTNEYVVMSNCSKCNSNTFKVYRDIDKKNVYIECSKCGSTPKKFYIDYDGVQVSYEEKLLSEIQQTMRLVEQRIYNLEGNIKDLESGQAVLEQSLAYINRYLIEKN